jgi:hypothetical protein
MNKFCIEVIKVSYVKAKYVNKKNYKNSLQTIERLKEEYPKPDNWR